MVLYVDETCLHRPHSAYSVSFALPEKPPGATFLRPRPYGHRTVYGMMLVPLRAGSSFSVVAIKLLSLLPQNTSTGARCIITLRPPKSRSSTAVSCAVFQALIRGHIAVGHGIDSRRSGTTCGYYPLPHVSWIRDSSRKPLMVARGVASSATSDAQENF